MPGNWVVKVIILLRPCITCRQGWWCEYAPLLFLVKSRQKNPGNLDYKPVLIFNPEKSNSFSQPVFIFYWFQYVLTWNSLSNLQRTIRKDILPSYTQFDRFCSTCPNVFLWWSVFVSNNSQRFWRCDFLITEPVFFLPTPILLWSPAYQGRLTKRARRARTLGPDLCVWIVV
jgi:hypothetical protein